jgi:hypothetical protein
LVEVASDQIILSATLYASIVGTSGQLSALTGVRDGVFLKFQVPKRSKCLADPLAGVPVPLDTINMPTNSI